MQKDEKEVPKPSKKRSQIDETEESTKRKSQIDETEESTKRNSKIEQRRESKKRKSQTDQMEEPSQIKVVKATRGGNRVRNTVQQMTVITSVDELNIDRKRRSSGSDHNENMQDGIGNMEPAQSKSKFKKIIDEEDQNIEEIRSDNNRLIADNHDRPENRKSRVSRVSGNNGRPSLRPSVVVIKNRKSNRSSTDNENNHRMSSNLITEANDMQQSRSSLRPRPSNVITENSSRTSVGSTQNFSLSKKVDNTNKNGYPLDPNIERNSIAGNIISKPKVRNSGIGSSEANKGRNSRQSINGKSGSQDRKKSVRDKKSIFGQKINHNEVDENKKNLDIIVENKNNGSSDENSI